MTTPPASPPRILMQICEPGETPLPHEGEQRAPAVGIDLGTTNSVIAVADGETVDILRDDNGDGLVPSVVFYGADETIVGRAAQRHLLDQPERVVSSIKRLMGRGREDIQSVAGISAYTAAETTNDKSMVRLHIGERTLTPVEISADILRALVARARDRLNQEVTQAVITVPAYFDDAARAATKDAARLAGLEVLRLVNEPTAAALAYGLDEAVEGLYAVYDLGGGTFDISILHMEKGVFQVRATGGDAALGGDDLDHAIADQFLKGRTTPPTQGEVKQALMTARLAKECLSSRDQGEWMLEQDGTTVTHRLDRATLEQLAAPVLDRTLSICRTVCADAGVDPTDVKGVVLVGGSTRMPLVRQKVAALFGQDPLVNINPDEVVAVGAALQAKALTIGSDTLLLDVTPLSLGLETMGGVVEKIIPRNSPIPVSLAQDFTTYQDGQTAMAIHVVQGEREMVDQNRSLAQFTLRGIPPMTAGAARIRVTFQVDADGLLTVSAQETTTGVEQQVAVKPSYGLSEDDMADMLRQSLEHARDDMTLRLLTEAKVEANRTALAIRAALAQDSALLAADEIATLNAALTAVEAALQGNDRDAVLQAAESLEQASKPFAEKRMDTTIRKALSGKAVSDI